MRGKPHVITEQNKRTVERMTGYGIPQKEIAHTIGCSLSCMRDNYPDELEQGATKANTIVLNHLFALATLKEKDKEGKETTRPDYRSANAAIFWARARCGWRDNRLEITGADGGPIQTIDLTKLTDEQLAAIEPVLAALVGQSGAGRGDSGDAGESKSGEGETRH